MHLQKGHHTVKSIRQRETNFIQAATLCSYVTSNFIVCSEPNLGKFKSASAKYNSRATYPKFWFWSSPAKRFSFEEMPNWAKKNLQGLGLGIKIAACAKNRFQTIIRRHGVTFS